MKYLFLLLVFYSASLRPQCQADAGPDKHSCPSDPDAYSVMIGGAPTALNGTPPYQYVWSIKPIVFVPGSSLPYLYASHVLNDTTAANPMILTRTLADSIMFYLKVSDSNGCISHDSVYVTFTNFNRHLFIYDYFVAPGDSVFLNRLPNIGGGYAPTTYTWRPAAGLSDTTLASGFWAKPQVSTSYSVRITDSKGCFGLGGGPLYNVYVSPVGIVSPAMPAIGIRRDNLGNTCLFSESWYLMRGLTLISLDGKKFPLALTGAVTSMDSLSPGIWILTGYFGDKSFSLRFLK